ncbi:MAG: ACT domain-containing protein [Christensenellales bacterium]
MRAVISVIGKDMIGILAAVSAECAASKMNVTDVTQSILQDMFVMIMMVEFTQDSIPFTEFSARLTQLGAEKGLDIHVMHEDIFNSMHRI